jgi:hypothetical protein
MLGFISTGGVPKRGDPIKAPNYKLASIGWIIIILGFIGL